MKSKKKLFISLFLVFAMLILTSSPVFSAGVNEDIAPSTVVDNNLSSSTTIDSTTIDIFSLNKSECMISEYVNAKDFNAASHIQRLADEEELDTYVFLNSDGSKSVYYMDENVKFVDKNGDVQEKDISLISNTDGYSITRNEFDLHIPTSASSGISMSYEGYDVKITPQTTVRVSPAKKVDDSVVYDGFFGTNTSLKYTPMLSGVKEDVIMKAYIPNASFNFIIDTDGLGLYNNKGEYYLAESESSKAVFNLGKVIIYDAIGKPGYGTMTVTTLTEGQKYMLSLSAPEEFLTDPTTVYPVTIDPTLTVSDDDDSNGDIEDTILYTNLPSVNYGSFRYLSLGYVDSAHGVGRVAIRIPGLYNSEDYNYISSNDIMSVKFYCMDNSGNSDQNINLYRITSPSWNEDEVTYDDGVIFSTEMNWGKSMPHGDWTDFDITSLVQGWKNGTYSAQSGFMLVNSDEMSSESMKKICSSEFTIPSYRPYVVMRYRAYIPEGTYIIENARTSKNIDIENKTMANGTIIHQWDYHGEPTQQWIISHHSDIYYTIKSAQNSAYYLSVQNDASGDAAIVLKSGTVTDGMKWEIIKVSDNKYKIISKSGTENNKALSLSSSTSTANGNDVVQRTYTDDSSYEDEWILYRINSMPTVNLELIYDGAYKTRYSDAQDRITYHARALRKVYMKSFGIWVNYFTPTQFVSYADANCYPSPTQACDHVSDTSCYNSWLSDEEEIHLEDLHHKNFANIWLRIPLPDLSQTVKASFVGHNCCSVKRDGDGNFISHGSHGANGVAYSNSGTCLITNFGSNQSELKTLIHEFGHFYGVQDHYDNGVPSTDQMNYDAGEDIFSEYCMYGEKLHDGIVLTNLTICEGCQRTIRTNMNKFNHE